MRPYGHVYDIYILGVRRMMRSKRLKMAWFRSSPVATVLALLEILAQHPAGGPCGGPG